MQILISDIVASAVDLADMQYSQFVDQSNVPNSEILRYLNIAYRDLYNQVVKAKERYFTIPTNISIVSGQDTYALPDNFYKLDLLEMTLNSAQGQYLTLAPFSWIEKNKYRAGILVPMSPYGVLFRYTIIGINPCNLIVAPIPNIAATFRCWYTPEPAPITSLTGTVWLPTGGNEYMALYMAELMLVKEESTDAAAAYNTKRVEVMQQLTDLLRERDEGRPTGIVDEATINLGAYYPFGMGDSGSDY